MDLEHSHRKKVRFSPETQASIEQNYFNNTSFRHPVNKILNDIYNELKYRGKVKSKADFAEKLHYNRSYVSVLFNSDTITEKVKEALVRIFKVNIKFVESGNGEMFEIEQSREDLIDEDREDWAERVKEQPIITSKRIPVYDAPAMAGNEYSADMTAVTKPTEYIPANELDITQDCDAVIMVWGQSMSPNYAPGTRLALEINNDNYFNWGEAMVIETRSNRLFKRIFPSDKGDDFISCHSDNTMLFESGSRKGKLAYPPIEVPISDIIKKFDVLASQKMHKTSKVQYLRSFRENQNSKS